MRTAHTAKAALDTSADSALLGVEALGHDGREAQETFLLLHGYAASSFSWRTWAPYLAARGRVLLVDMKGHGRAAKPRDQRYTPADQAALVRALILEHDLDRLTLVGHSMGGGVALYVSLGLRDAGQAHRLRRLVLVAGAAFRQRLPPFVTLARHPRFTGAVLATLGPEFLIAQALRSLYFDRSAITGDQVRGYADPLHDRDTRRALLTTALQILPEDLDRVTARYGEIDVPTLLLWGRHDRAVPLWVGRRLASVLPKGELHVIERCGHMPAEERPAESLAALGAFLERHP
jgi:pimeloyl-ACP methyl ester carboxylesterase